MTLPFSGDRNEHGAWDSSALPLGDMILMYLWSPPCLDIEDTLVLH